MKRWIDERRWQIESGVNVKVVMEWQSFRRWSVGDDKICGMGRSYVKKHRDKKISVYLFLSLLVVQNHFFVNKIRKLLLILKESKARATLHVTRSAILVNKGLKRKYFDSLFNLFVFCYFASLGCWSDLWGEVEDKNVKRRKNAKNPVIILATWKMQCTECSVLKMTQQVYCRVVVECRIGNSSHSNLPSSVVTRRRTEFLPFTRNSSLPPSLSPPIPPLITNKSFFSKNIFKSFFCEIGRDFLFADRDISILPAGSFYFGNCRKSCIALHSTKKNISI